MYILKLSTLNEPSVGPSKISVIRDIFRKMVCSSLLYFEYQVMKALIENFYFLIENTKNTAMTVMFGIWGIPQTSGIKLMEFRLEI